MISRPPSRPTLHSVHEIKGRCEDDILKDVSLQSIAIGTRLSFQEAETALALRREYSLRENPQ